MRPSFLPRLVNGSLFDPVVYVRLLNTRRALLFDCGHFEGLAPRELLRLEALCISHTHMDHFMGFDRVLRAILHRLEPLDVYGPEGITEKTLSRLGSYTWNLVAGYALGITIHEILPGCMHVTKVRADAGFGVVSRETLPRQGFLVSSGPRYTLEAAVLDHVVPCLGYVLKEPVHISILKGESEKRGYVPGPWIGDLKECLMAGRLDDPIRVTTVSGFREIRAGDLGQELTVASRGQTLAYVTDASFTSGNLETIAALARGVDTLFIEAYYLDELSGFARARGHLTARQAGTIAGMLGAGKVYAMHISPRHHNRAREVSAELEAALGRPAARPE
ncbi:MAG: MBL fold metallo-hydrolase [Desulfomonilia bacterium]